MSGRYILEGHRAVPCEDLLVWAKWFDNSDRTVSRDIPVPGVLVSTVFLGIDHNLGGVKRALFETMVFGRTPLDRESARYATWEEAENGHTMMVVRVLEAAAKKIADDQQASS